MTVKDLIEQLNLINQDATVFVWDDGSRRELSDDIDPWDDFHVDLNIKMEDE